MTLDRKPWQNYRLLEPCECVDCCDLGEVPPFYNPIEPEIQPKPCPGQRPDVDTAYKELRQPAFERLLDQLSGTELLGRHYAERYLRYQYRRGGVMEISTYRLVNHRALSPLLFRIFW
jgi:hypothetical protein